MSLYRSRYVDDLVHVLINRLDKEEYFVINEMEIKEVIFCFDNID